MTDATFMGAYDDDEAVGRVTADLVRHGHTVFQLFQFGGSERVHAETILTLLNPPRGMRVLSLGSGVGGMEAIWQDVRPDLTFELVNDSAAQLDLTVCDGVRTLADAQGYVSPMAPFDIVVMAYMLGHTDFAKMMETAKANLRVGGRLLIYDVFDCTPHFKEAMQYDAPTTQMIVSLGRAMLLAPIAFVNGNIPMGVVARTLCPWVIDEARPGLYILEYLDPADRPH